MKWYVKYVYNISGTILAALPVVFMLELALITAKDLLYDSQFISLVVLTSIVYFVSVMWYDNRDLDYRIRLELEAFRRLVIITLVNLVRNDKIVKDVLYSIIIIILEIPIIIVLLIIKILMEI